MNKINKPRERCKECGGTGIEDDNEYITCKECGGTGRDVGDHTALPELDAFFR
jgi:DnaJ-class molecular chaperone